MNKRTKAADRRGLLLGLFVLALAVALIALPYQFQSEAGSKKSNWRTESHEPGFDNYDIRLDEDKAVLDDLKSFRQAAGSSADLVETSRKGFATGEESLRQRIPTLKVEYNLDLRSPEVIAPDPTQGRAVMTSASNKKHGEILRDFIGQNDSLIGLDNYQAAKLKITADYTNPDGNLSYAHLEQFIDDIPVFNGEIKAGFTRRGEMFRIINNLAPGLNYESISRNFGDPTIAVQAAFKNVSRQITMQDTAVDAGRSTDLRTVYGGGDDATMAEKMYFPIEPGVARPAWRISIWQAVNAYYVIVDAETGRMLWRKNTTQDQTQPATYNIYSDESPSPLSPTNATPGSGIQGTGVSRTSVTLIGNEAPATWNNLGWITDGTNGTNGHTDGNNVEAGLDIAGGDGVDAPVPGTGRVFNFTYNPPPTGAEAPGLAAYRNGIVTNLFYHTNKYHDFVYGAGFTEAARNFQNDNFGRNPSGANANAIAGVDRVRGEAQDSSGTNNANFNTQADGIRGRMQMYLFTGPSPQRDGSLDLDVVIHELTHGTSNRLIGNASGLTNNRGGSMGEGWGDFYGRMYTSTADENVNAVYAMGGYVTLNFQTLGTNNYYYGIRRFPYAVMTNTGGPSNRPHNPLTLADIDPVQLNTSDGAYAITPWISNTATEVHNAGEVWCMMLLEVRARLITRMGFAAGNQRMLQITTDGMKLTPSSPNFIQARNAIIQADQNAFGGADLADIWGGFAVRGAGFGAQDGLAASAVIQSFNLPNVEIVDPFSVSDSVGDNDGFPEPGENVILNVTVTNNTGNTLNGVVGNVTGGGSANYGTMANATSQTKQIAYTIPADAPCGSLHSVTLNVNSTEVPTPNTSVKSFRLGVPVGGAPVSFTNATPIDMPSGQPTTTSGPGNPYPSTINVSGLTGNKVMRLRFNGFHHEFIDDLDMLLVGPGGQKYIFMSDVGGTTEQLTPITFSITDGAAAILPNEAAIPDGSEFRPSNVGAGDTFAAPAPAAPYDNAATAGSSTFASVFGTSGAALNGTWSLYIVDDAGQDPGRIDGGWTLTFESNDYNCVVGPAIANSDARADFDGDNKTDISVFRPSTGTWYLNRSTGGFAAINWGLSGDTLIPGDYDGDDKTDTAVFRPSNTAGVPDFYILRSSNSTVFGIDFGLVGDVPIVGDFTGGDLDDFAVYRQSTGHWYTYANPASLPTFGPEGSIVTITFVGTTGTPVSGDFDGDDIEDLTMFNAGVWTIRKSTGGTSTVNFGQAGDKLVPGDYDGDGKDDQAVFRNGQWLIHGSLGADTTINWGLNTDVPVPGDYDGDGKSDAAVYRNGVWYVNGTASGIQISTFGLGSDTAIPNKYQQ